MRYSLPHAGRVRISIFDVTGRRIATLVDAEQAGGDHQTTWAGAGSLGSEFRPGLYFLDLESGAERARSRVVLLPR